MAALRVNHTLHEPTRAAINTYCAKRAPNNPDAVKIVEEVVTQSLAGKIEKAAIQRFLKLFPSRDVKTIAKTFAIVEKDARNTEAIRTKKIEPVFNYKLQFITRLAIRYFVKN